eukprot:TRINITY_DN97172_c0_g1_i1.p1 TRINITY_DN97172_c0_g1~~TRINITY_DN97172_c0_g1_i1.p1  ORF type:complete len:207 (+),score=43.79 TRINITY_DN97172_c0_g1_i1:206-826(+)
MDASLLVEFPWPTQPPPGLEAYGPNFSALDGLLDKQVESKEDLESNIGSSECSTADTSLFDNSSMLVVPVPKPYEAGWALRDAVRMDSALNKNSCKLDLERALPEQACGFPGCPSVGSAGHHLGLCKPCDFMYRTACKAGASCYFCHLCPPGEIQRRKKDRKALTRVAAFAAAHQSWFGASLQIPIVPAGMLLLVNPSHSSNKSSE